MAPSVDSLHTASHSVIIKREDSKENISEAVEEEDRKDVINPLTCDNLRSEAVAAFELDQNIQPARLPESEFNLDDYIPGPGSESDGPNGLASNDNRATTPTLSSLETVKRRHWTPQHPKSPPPTPKRIQSAKRSSSRLKAAHSSKTKPSSRTPKQPSLGRGKRRLTKTAILSAPSSKNPRVADEDDEFWRPHTPQKRVRRSTQLLPLTPPSSGESPRNVERVPVIYHFSLVDTSLGIISKPSEICPTHMAFFKAAASAAIYLSQDSHPPTLEGVAADIDGEDLRLQLTWQNKFGYEMLRDAINQAAQRKKGKIDVKIFCLRKNLPDLQKLPPLK